MCALWAMLTTASAQRASEVVDSVKSGLKSSSVKEAVEKIKNAFAAKVAAADSLLGSWEFREAAVASTSTKMLRKAAGKAMAKKLKKVMADYTEKSGINAQNTNITFNKNGTFSSCVVKRKANGTWILGGERLMLAKKNVQTAELTVRMEKGELTLLATPKRVLDAYQSLGGVPDNLFVEGLEKITKLAPNIKCGFLFVKKQNNKQ